MKMRLLILIFSLILLTGCATYEISKESLQSQLEASHYNGKINELSQVKCIDKDGNEKTLLVSPQKSIRITKMDDSRQQFYLITTYIQDSLIMGSKSAIFHLPIKSIKISEIKKIEIDGR